ncbi:cytochrome P450 [Cyathus striatus]|nr:cytochrome P450 [Cyathus striatus]
MIPLLNIILPLALLLGLWKLLTGSRRVRGLPPGPSTTPFFGNALQLPPIFIHLKLAEWAKKFGEIYSIKVLSQTIVIISGPEAVRNILEKQGMLSGGRQPSQIADMLSEGLYLPLQDMNNWWKKGRKHVHAAVSEESLAKYLPLHDEGSISFLKDVLDSPKDIYTHIKKMTVSIMHNQIFGKPCLQYENDTPEKFFESTKAANECFEMTTQTILFGMLPFHKWIPERWTSWKTRCRTALKLRRDLWGSLLSESEQLIKEGKAKGCYLETILQHNDGPDALNRDEIEYLGGVMLDTGAETSCSFLQTLLLAFLNNPECQEKAKKELDELIPSDRLPVLDDFINLTYLQAFIKEVHRYRPLFPVVPHFSTGDISYKGYCIPKGTTLFMNIWHLFNDPEFYDKPESFNPERFMATKFGTKPGVETKDFRNNFAFGAGRRICPGEQMAGRVVALNAMRWLWSFEFSKDTSGLAI